MTNFQFNNEQFNQDHLLIGAIQDSIEFNSYSLMSYFGGTDLGIAVQGANLFDLTNIDIAQFVSEQIDGGSIEQKKYGNRSISLSLFIQGSSYSDLVNRIELLKKNTKAIEGNLDIRVNGEMRTYKATVSSLTFPSFGMLEDCLEGIQMNLIITSPHWVLKSAVTHTTPEVGDNEKIILNAGTYEVYPKIILAFQASGNAVTRVDIGVKKVGETTTYDVSIIENITDNDVLIIDYKEKTATLNGVEVNFSGFMTPMQDGHTVFDFDYTGTVNVTQYITYNPTYL